MSMNKCLQEVRLPFDMHGSNMDSDDKTPFLFFTGSVKRNYKAEGEQYYPEDLLPFKAWGAKAKFIFNNFKKGDSLIIESEVRMGEAYTDKDDVEHEAMPYLHIVDAYFTNGGKSKDSGEKSERSEGSGSKGGAKASGSKPAGGAKAAGNKPASTPPLGGKKSGRPF